jgi:hypothetical protein
MRPHANTPRRFGEGCFSFFRGRRASEWSRPHAHARAPPRPTAAPAPPRPNGLRLGQVMDQPCRGRGRGWEAAAGREVTPRAGVARASRLPSATRATEQQPGRAAPFLSSARRPPCLTSNASLAASMVLVVCVRVCVVWSGVVQGPVTPPHTQPAAGGHTPRRLGGMSGGVSGGREPFSFALHSFFFSLAGCPHPTRPRTRGRPRPRPFPPARYERTRAVATPALCLAPHTAARVRAVRRG